MKSFLLVLVAVAICRAVSIKLTANDPIPEKPNQYNRVCDETQADSKDCWAGNP